ncbi:MAG: hypothetical protein RBT65_11085 [Methanolobus sp.]|nr:hypothetical protein [Methanolobus sp.]
MEMKGDLSCSVIHNMLEDTKKRAEDNFCMECNNKDVCKTAFTKLFQELALLLMEDKVTESSLVSSEIDGYRYDSAEDRARRLYDH